MITLKTAQAEFFAEMTLSGYRCEHSTVNRETAETQRVRVHGKDGVIGLTSADEIRAPSSTSA